MRRDGGMEEGGGGVVMDNRDAGENDMLCWTDKER